MEYIAIILALLGSIYLIQRFANQFKTTEDGGTKYGSIMKILFNSIAFIVLLAVPITGMQIAENTGHNGLYEILQLSAVPIVFLFIVYIFVTLWIYLEDLVKIMAGKSSEMDQDQF